MNKQGSIRCSAIEYEVTYVGSCDGIAGARPFCFYSFMDHTNHHLRHARNIFTAGFTLVEMMICVLLVGVIAMAIGMAMHQTYQHSDQLHVRLTLSQRQEGILRRLTSELNALQMINDLTINTIEFVLPDDAGGTRVINYDWNDNEHQLSRRVNHGSPLILAENMYDFQLKPDILIEGADQVLRGITVVVQWSDAVSDCQSCYIPLLNQPVI